MNTTKLTEGQKALLYGLKLYKVAKEDAVAIVALLEAEDQILLIHYMKIHPEATPQDILNESGRLLRQRKNLREGS